LPPQPCGKSSKDELDGKLTRLPGFLEVAQLQNLIERGHQGEKIGTQFLFPESKFVPVEDFSHYCAAGLRTPWFLVVVIRPIRNTVQPDALLHQELDHFRSCLQIGAPALGRRTRRIRGVFHDLVEIVCGLIQAVLDPVPTHEGIVRNPHDAA
jgi:hypothetical protein